MILVRLFSLTQLNNNESGCILSVGFAEEFLMAVNALDRKPHGQEQKDVHKKTCPARLLNAKRIPEGGPLQEETVGKFFNFSGIASWQEWSDYDETNRWP